MNNVGHCLFFALALAASGSAANAQEIEATTPTTTSGPSKIVLVGDSTTAVTSGWGSAFCDHHVTAGTACINLARGGRSTSSFRREGFWKLALDELRVPGYAARFVLIQFGHNDQPGKPGRSTDLVTEFPNNLKQYVRETRAIGAIPVLVTPLTRREFISGKLQNTLEPWANAILKVAAEEKTPVIDLNRASAAAVSEMGPVASMRFAQRPPSAAAKTAANAGTTLPSDPSTRSGGGAARTPEGPQGRISLVYDHTHLGDDGAEYFAAMVADLLAKAVPDLRRRLLP